MNKEKHRLYTKIRIKPAFMAERVGFEPISYRIKVLKLQAFLEFVSKIISKTAPL